MQSIASEFHDLLDAAPDAMVVVDRHGQVTALNPEAERFFGWPERDLLGKPMSRFIPTRFQRLLGPDPEAHRASIAIAPADHTVNCFALRHDGTEFPVELSRRPLGRGREAQSLVTLRDRSEWSHARGNRSRNNEQARATLESIGDSVITTDAACRITYLNPAAERLTGWVVNEARGQLLDAVLALISEASRQPVANTAARCLEENRSIDLEDGVLLVRRDGVEVPVGDSAAPVRDRSGTVIGVVLVIQDESEKRRVGNRLSYEASHDALTGLFNRREFERRLAAMVTDASTNGSEHVLICLDLDRFKAVNDRCGHDAGDALLRSLGPLFSSRLRKCDTLARLGGDEFAMLLENCPLAEAELIGESLRTGIARFRFEWAGKGLSIGASIGVVPIVTDSGGIEAVLRAADVACYAAKGSGGGRVHLDRRHGERADMPQRRVRRG